MELVTSGLLNQQVVSRCGAYLCLVYIHKQNKHYLRNICRKYYHEMLFIEPKDSVTITFQGNLQLLK